jgi:hypothetical protein
MDQPNDDELVAEAGGGGNRVPPPPEVMCGDDPERHGHWDRLRRELVRQQQLAMRAEAIWRQNELRRQIREIHNRPR